MGELPFLIKCRRGVVTSLLRFLITFLKAKLLYQYFIPLFEVLC